MKGKVKVLVTIPVSLYRKVSRIEDEEKLRRFADIIFNPYDRNLTEDEFAELIMGVDGCITSWGSPRFTEKVLANADKLKIIGHAAGSVKPYVTDEVFKRGIVVVNAASAIGAGVAEFTLAMILNCLRAIPQHIEAMRARNWRYKEEKGIRTYDLRGKTVGLVGFGFVARELAKLLKPFEVRILVYDPYVSLDEVERYGAEKTELDRLLSLSDIVSLHAASTPETYHMIGRREFKLMKPNAILINTARGALIDEEALIEALKTGRIAWAALDVFEKEPLPEDSPLYDLDNIFLTPHIAGLSDERRSMLFGVVVEDFRRFFSGEKPLNTVEYSRLRFLA
ncbi:MAG: hydroxyacid dehydrogenase [Candidatus Bathyarchaeota archaeon]|nr:hydroxyacid dehydrogenase [Candidatus Bathyarchaeota archaeon]